MSADLGRSPGRGARDTGLAACARVNVFRTRYGGAWARHHCRRQRWRLAVAPEPGSKPRLVARADGHPTAVTGDSWHRYLMEHVRS